MKTVIQMDKIHFEVIGDPKAQKRHRTVSIGGKARQYDPDAAKKKGLLQIVQEHAPVEPWLGPLHADVVFIFTRPKSHFRTGKNSHILRDDAPTYHTSRNDIDNLCKMVFDAINGVFFKDDGQIASLVALKVYGPQPKTVVTIQKLEP